MNSVANEKNLREIQISKKCLTSLQDMGRKSTFNSVNDTSISRFGLSFLVEQHKILKYQIPVSVDDERKVNTIRVSSKLASELKKIDNGKIGLENIINNLIHT